LARGKRFDFNLTGQDRGFLVIEQGKERDLAQD
jgi:hypothetical protein